MAHKQFVFLCQNASNLIHVSNSHQIFPHTWTFELRTHIWGLWSCGHKGFKLYLVLVHVGHYVYCALWILEQTLYSFFIRTCIQYENIFDAVRFLRAPVCTDLAGTAGMCPIKKGEGEGIILGFLKVSFTFF